MYHDVSVQTRHVFIGPGEDLNIVVQHLYQPLFDAKLQICTYFNLFHVFLCTQMHLLNWLFIRLYGPFFLL